MVAILCFLEVGSHSTRQVLRLECALLGPVKFKGAGPRVAVVAGLSGNCARRVARSALIRLNTMAESTSFRA